MDVHGCVDSVCGVRVSRVKVFCVCLFDTMIRFDIINHFHRYCDGSVFVSRDGKLMMTWIAGGEVFRLAAGGVGGGQLLSVLSVSAFQDGFLCCNGPLLCQ